MKPIEICATVQAVICPFCGSAIEGWLGDPRGAGIELGTEPVECEDCMGKFEIPYNAEVRLT